MEMRKRLCFLVGIGLLTCAPESAASEKPYAMMLQQGRKEWIGNLGTIIEEFSRLRRGIEWEKVRMGVKKNRIEIKYLPNIFVDSNKKARLEFQLYGGRRDRIGREDYYIGLNFKMPF
jgi:hypothetical protein